MGEQWARASTSPGYRGAGQPASAAYMNYLVMNGVAQHDCKQGVQAASCLMRGQQALIQHGKPFNGIGAADTQHWFQTPHRCTSALTKDYFGAYACRSVCRD